MRRVHGRGGYLLIEALAVLALMVIVFGAVLGATVGRERRAGVGAVVSAARSADAAARAAAVSHGGAVLRLEGSGGVLGVWSPGMRERLSRVSVSGVVFEIVDAESGGRLGGVAFDRIGRCEPYVLRSASGGAGFGVLRFSAYGVCSVIEGPAGRSP